MASAHSFGVLAALAFGSGLVRAAGTPAGQSLPPRLVDDADLLQANSLLAMADQSAIVLGPLVAAVVIADLGARAGDFTSTPSPSSSAPYRYCRYGYGPWPRRSAKHHCRET